MSILLVRGITTSNYEKGDIVEARSEGSPFGNKEIPPNFVKITVQGKFNKDFEPYRKIWKVNPTFHTNTHDGINDIYNVTLSAKIVSPSNVGIISNYDDYNSAIANWGTEQVSSIDNAMVLNCPISDMIQSRMFSRFPTALWNQMVFSELDYNQISGIHRVRLSYVTLGNNPTYIENTICMRVTPISHSNRELIFEALNTEVLSYFQDSVIGCEPVVKKRRYGLTDSLVDMALANGGDLTITEQDFLGNLRDKQAE